MKKEISFIKKLLNYLNKIEMKKEDFIKFLLPLVAVVVIVESVALISGLEDKKKTIKPVAVTEETENALEKEDPALGLSFATESKTMTVGKKYKIALNVVGMRDLSFDSAELYLSYDPELIEISNLSFSGKLPKPVFSKVSEKTSLVVVTYLITAENGVSLNQSDVLELMTFEVKALKVGQGQISIATGNDSEESVTMFVESKIGKVLPFSISSLEIETVK